MSWMTDITGQPGLLRSNQQQNFTNKMHKQKTKTVGTTNDLSWRSLDA